MLRIWVAKMSDAVLCYDEKAREELIRFGVNPDFVFVAPNSIDTENYSKLSASLSNSKKLSSFRCKYELHVGSTLVFASRLVQRKRIDLIIEIVRFVAESNPTIKLLIIGDGPHREHLEQQVRDLKLERNVVFLGETYDDETLALCFAAADAMLYPVNMGLTLMLAAATSVPVISHANLRLHGPEAVWLLDRQNALLVDSMDPQEFAGAVIQLLNDNTLHNEITKNAKREVETRFGLKRMRDGFRAAVIAAKERRVNSNSEPS